MKGSSETLCASSSPRDRDQLPPSCRPKAGIVVVPTRSPRPVRYGKLGRSLVPADVLASLSGMRSLTSPSPPPSSSSDDDEPPTNITPRQHHLLTQLHHHVKHHQGAPHTPRYEGPTRVAVPTGLRSQRLVGRQSIRTPLLVEWKSPEVDLLLKIVESSSSSRTPSSSSLVTACSHPNLKASNLDGRKTSWESTRHDITKHLTGAGRDSARSATGHMVVRNERRSPRNPLPTRTPRRPGGFTSGPVGRHRPAPRAVRRE